MKIVYFGYDFMLPAVQYALGEGHELAGILSFECDNIFNFNRECQALAQECGAPFILSQAEDFHLQGFLDRGADVFLAAGYPYKIPSIDEAQAYGVNVHPAYLPKGRGLMPVPRIILDGLDEAAGLTAHKMTQDFDAGDILLQQKFDLDPHESVESYNEKILAAAPGMFVDLLARLPELWSAAMPQDASAATHLKAPSDQDRLFDWSKTVAEIDRVGRAFGHFGSLAMVDGQMFAVFAYEVREEPHTLQPGTRAEETAAQKQSRDMVIAAQDGFIVLKKFQALEAA